MIMNIQSAVSWDGREMFKLMAHFSVTFTTLDQCMYGLETRADGGGTLPALKPTRFLTNSKPMSELLKTRCDKSHQHQALTSGRCAHAAFYPLPLVRTLIRGIRDTKRADGKRMEKLNAIMRHADELDADHLILAVADTDGAARIRVIKVGG